jgi:hypothetical protein
MKCLSIRQPWLWAIERMDWKRVENRTWACPPDVIGTVIALHASKRFDRDAEFPPDFDWHGEPPLTEPEFHLGAIGSVARITGCHHVSGCRHICPEPEDWDGVDLPCTEYDGACVNLCSPWSAHDQYHWLLTEVQVLPEPVPHKGTLGLRPLPDDVESAVRAQLARRA